MCRGWGRQGMHREFWGGRYLDIEHLEAAGKDRITLGWIFKKHEGGSQHSVWWRVLVLIVSNLRVLLSARQLRNEIQMSAVSQFDVCCIPHLMI
jgi:hypothetical protein